VKQEYEKQDELKRSALRAVVALLKIPKAGKFQKFPHLNSFSNFSSLDKNQHLIDFLSLIKNSTELQPLYESVQRDSSSIVHGDGLSMDQS
jgi:cullin-associated NEDD8-dissociated protein 1